MHVCRCFFIIDRLDHPKVLEALFFISATAVRMLHEDARYLWTQANGHVVELNAAERRDVTVGLRLALTPLSWPTSRCPGDVYGAR